MQTSIALYVDCIWICIVLNAIIVGDGSASVFGVSAESMQCSYDRKGNSVPTILLLLQERLYDQGGLKVNGSINHVL